MSILSDKKLKLWFQKINLTNHEDVFFPLLAETGFHHFLTSRTVQIIIRWGSAPKTESSDIPSFTFLQYALCRNKMTIFYVIYIRLFRPRAHLSQGPWPVCGVWSRRLRLDGGQRGFGGTAFQYGAVVSAVGRRDGVWRLGLGQLRPTP